MPQGVVRPAGVAEGHVPELDVILPVRALLRGEAPLVHAVGDVQKFEEPLQEGAVAPDIRRRLEKAGDAQEEVGSDADILRHLSQAKGSAPGFQADVEIDNARERHRHRGGGRRPEAHRALGAAGDGGAWAKALVPDKVHLADVLLLTVHPQVRGPLPLPAHVAVEAEGPVAEPPLIHIAIHIGVPLIAAVGRKGCGRQHGSQHREREKRGVEEGHAAPLRHPGLEKAHREGEASHHLENRRQGLFKLLPGLQQAVACEVLRLGDPAELVIDRLTVHIGIVHLQPFLHVGLLVDQPPGAVLLHRFPVREDGVQQRQRRRGEQQRQRVPAKGHRVPASCQLGNQPRREPHRHIRTHGLPQGGEPHGPEKGRAAPAVDSPGPKCPRQVLTPFPLLHAHPLPPDSICSARRRAPRNHRPFSAAPRGSPPPRSGRVPERGCGRRSGWRPAGG